MTLTRIAYVSNHSGLAAGVLEDISEISSSNNKRDDITGVLVVCEEDFFQILEGKRTVVSECIRRIMNDVRHQKINIIFAGDAQTRLFPVWGTHNVERDVMLRHMTSGEFDPALISEGEVVSLCLEMALTN